MHRILNVISVIALILSLSSCYGRKQNEITNFMKVKQDTMGYYARFHYTTNYNFVVKADSLILFKQQPEEVVGRLSVDSVIVRKGDNLVVADFRILSADSIDSVWVQVARDQQTFGWVHESTLLPNVVPDDPISQFISTFSDRHLILFLAIITLIGSVYLIRIIQKRNAKIVHFNDIDTFYPTLLTVIVASAATFYASIQMFSPETWRHFYYNPTLNPFSTPPLLSVFLISVWAMLIVAVAVLDVVRRILSFGQALLYIGGLAAVCAIDYIVFSLTTLYYIGYILLAAYVFFAFYRYFNVSHCQYVCGNCGERIHHKGRCPYCGAMNE